MTDIAISFKNVTKTFYLQEDRTFKDFLPNLLSGKSWAKKFLALSDVSFDISIGETVGIIGKNGAGKSTILKLIAGITSPTKGSVEINGRVAPLIEIGAGFHHELTGLENIFLNAAILGMHKKEIDLVVSDIIKFSELGDFINVPVKRYSSGMYMRLGFAVAIYTNAPILLIDEVLAVGDVPFQKKCLDFLKEMRESRTKTIVFISHNEAAVKKFCDRSILIEHGKVVSDGATEDVIKAYHKILDDISLSEQQTAEIAT